jgi:hypothetical protein
MKTLTTEEKKLIGNDTFVWICSLKKEAEIRESLTDSYSLQTPDNIDYVPFKLDWSYGIVVQDDPVNLIDPLGLFVIGGGGSGSLGAFGVADVAGGAVIDTSGNVAGFAYGGVSSVPQFAASAGGTVIVAPFAKTVTDIQGATFDLQIRFAFQATVSVPVDFNFRNTVFSFDFTPGINLGIGFGGGVTKVFGVHSLAGRKDNAGCGTP